VLTRDLSERTELTGRLNASRLFGADGSGPSDDIEVDQLIFCQFVRPVSPFDGRNKRIEMPSEVDEFDVQSGDVNSTAAMAERQAPSSRTLTEVILAWQFNTIVMSYHGTDRRQVVALPLFASS